MTSRRAMFALVLLALIFTASAASTAHADAYPIQSLNATITLPDGWSRIAPTPDESDPQTPSSDYRSVFHATRDEGRHSLDLFILAAANTTLLSCDNLDDANPTDLKLLREFLREEMDAKNITTLRTAQTTALCFHSKDPNGQKTYASYLRYRGTDVFLVENASAGRQLVSRDYETFRNIVASLVFEAPRAPRTAGEPFLGLEAAHVWMEGLADDLSYYGVS
ncbi:MAG TPA: hypothetical protein PKE04_13340, partial [Clostridia bacterium]|nr:hypothetical protein [Clostridia bacterium]